MEEKQESFKAEMCTLITFWQSYLNQLKPLSNNYFQAQQNIVHDF